MEQRFRERADRSGGPISTGEIDARVQDEMNEFFTASSQKLEEVVPGLAVEENRSMEETTGEIRRKIDDFFSQVSTGGESAGAGPAESGFGVEAPREEPAVAAPEPPQQGDPGGRIRPTDPFGRPLGDEASTVPAAEPEPPFGQRAGLPPSAFGKNGPVRPPSLRGGAAGGERPSLDLKTALEKLKRSGVVNESARAIKPGSAAAEPEPQPEPVPPPQPREPEPAPEPTPAPRPRQIRPPETARQADRREEREIPAPRSVEPASSKSESVPGARLDRFAFHSEEGPRPGPRKPKTQAIPAPPPTGPISIGRPLPPEPQRSEPPAPRGFPIPEQDAQAPPPPSEALPQFGAAARVEVRDDADPAGSFDNIFNEVQNLVLDSLRDSVSDTFGHAQELTNEISQEISQRISQRISDVAMRAAKAARAQIDAERAQRKQASKPQPEPPEKDARRAAAGAYPRLETEPGEPPSPDRGPAQRPERGAGGPALSQTLAAPTDDEDEFADPVEEAPPAPYDWGVKKKQQPPGAWLLNSDDPPSSEKSASARPQRPESAERPERPPPAARPAPEPGATSEPEAPVDQPSGSAGGMGARGYLMKKLGQEMDKLGPTIDALAKKGVVVDDELRELKGDEPEFDDDAELSVDTFVDDRPRDEAAEGMTPMKLVEQLRNVRRLQELLLSKGLISAEDLEKPPEE